ncbi:malate dehydrogenase [bacterium]|nr:MAG: malate dehydrogenase [bacterium]
MKISVIGAGNVGSLTAMRIAQENLGEVVLYDIVKGLAQGKACDLQDSRGILKNNYIIRGTDDIAQISASDIVVITAGLARKPGMSREDLLHKNAEILKSLVLNIKKSSPDSILVIVTNPLDIMTYLALKISGFAKHKVLGMGVTLDASRFANLISQELNVPVSEIEPALLGSHSETMIPLPRLTNINGSSLSTRLSPNEISTLIDRTKNRGAEIVSLLGNASAFFAPSAAITDIIKSIARDQKRKLAVSVYLKGEYGINDLCLGVPCILGRDGVQEIIELDLLASEKSLLLESAQILRKNLEIIKPYLS